MTERIEVRTFLDNAGLQPFHFLILGICFMTSLVDGLDTQAIGFSAPAIAHAHGLPLASFGIIFSANTIATLLGAALLGPLADRLGRRPMLMVCTIIIAIFTALTPHGDTVVELSIIRFIGGIGLGGAIPCYLTLVSEYAPKKHKGFATGLLWAGYPLGGMIGALLGSYYLAAGGWEMIFYIGGALALLAALLQFMFLPESLHVLVAQSTSKSQNHRIARKLYPERTDTDFEFSTDTKKTKTAPIADVFSEQRTYPTILIWVALFMTFMLTKFMVLWMPGLLEAAGMTLSTAALMLALANFASLPSMIASGFLLDRVGPYRVLPVAYGLLAIAIGVLAVSLSALPVVAATVVVIGFLQGPGIAGMLHITASQYPLKIRSSGVGLAMGVGRSGQVASSAIVGWLLVLGFGVRPTVMVMAIPPLVALICVVMLGVNSKRRNDSSAASAALKPTTAQQ